MQTIYYLVKFNAFEVKADFAHVVAELKRYGRFGVDKENDQMIEVRSETLGSSFSVQIDTTASSPFGDTGSILIVTCEAGDLVLMNLVRQIGMDVGYRMFSVEQGSFMPEDTKLYPINPGVLTEKATEVFKSYNLVPIFGYRDRVRYFAKDQAGRVHIVNPALLEYYVTFGINKADSREFSYVVAEDVPHFVAMHDMGVLPEHFYDFYQRSLTFHNYSGFDIWKVKRKVFIKPYLFTYDPERSAYELLTSDKAVLNFADKIRRGENLKTAVERVLKEEFGITEPYQRVRIARNVEFDKDKNDLLTPRLNVALFFEQLTLSPEVERKTKRGWTSLDKVVN